MIESIGQLVRRLPRSRRKELVLLGFLMLLSSAVDAGSIIGLAHFLDKLIAVDKADFVGSALIFTGLVVLAGSLRFALGYATQHFGHYSSRDLLIAAHRNWLDQPYLNHLQRNSAKLLATPERIDQAIFGLMIPLLQAAAAGLSLACLAIALILVDGAAILLVLAGLVAAFTAIGMAVRGYLAGASTEANRAYEDRVRAIQESHGGIRDIILDRSQASHVDRLSRAANALAKAGVTVAAIGALPRQMIEIIGVIALAIIAVVFSLQPGGLAPALPLLGALALAGQRMLPNAQSLFQAWGVLWSHRSIVDDVLRVLAPRDGRDEAPPPTLAFNESICLTEVSFRYPGLSKAAIDQVSLTIRRGERLVITGPSGAGKSTLVDLVMGLLAAQEGTITIDGTPCLPAQLQQLASHVPQQPYFADQTMADAISGSANGEQPQSRLDRAVRLAGLEEVVARLPKGLATPMGELAVRLSGGERQRIALARAIHRDAPLLILDEATSAVDDRTERMILDGLDEQQARGTTIIVIAHRGGMLTSGGRTVQMAGGRIVVESAAIAPSFEHQD